jgi:DNA-binding GntR family transcriptional regulator
MSRDDRAKTDSDILDAALPHEHPTTRSIYGVLRQEIVSLRLKPGTRLSENELAVRFRTSRAPVREALIRLVEDGLIDVRPQRGSFVSRISLQAMERARFVREALEVAIIRRAAELGMPGASRMKAETAILSQIGTRDDPEQFIRHDDTFHCCFAEGAGVAGVWAIIEREKAQFDRVRILSLPEATPVDILVAQHRKILEAVVDRRPVEAEQAVRAHMSEVLCITEGLAQRYPDLFVPTG